MKRGVRFGSPVDLLVHLLSGQADVLAQIVRDASQAVDAIEDRQLAERPRHSRAELASMRRVLVRLQRLLAPEPAALFRLLNRPPAWLDADAVQGLRESSEEFAVALNDLGALTERLKLLQEELAAQLNEVRAQHEETAQRALAAEQQIAQITERLQDADRRDARMRERLSVLIERIERAESYLSQMELAHETA